ncbi:hypothetical protein V6Z11_D12G157200 [Gossypium hirsutum]
MPSASLTYYIMYFPWLCLLFCCGTCKSLLGELCLATYCQTNDIHVIKENYKHDADIIRTVKQHHTQSLSRFESIICYCLGI